MANMNTFAGFQNLTAINWSVGAVETGYVIPAAGVYPSLPSPTQVALNWLTIPALAGDVNAGVLDYGRPFRVRVNGVINSAQSENITVKIYQATQAKFLAGITATANGTVIASTGALATGAAVKGHFCLDAVLQWDSLAKTLTGYQLAMNGMNGTTQTYVAAAVTTPATGVTALAESDLNFFFTITSSVGTGDIMGPLDFTIDRF